MDKKQRIGYFWKFVIFKEGPGHYVAYNKFNGEFVAAGDTLQEIELALLDIKDAEQQGV